MDYDDPYLRELLSRLDNSSVARQVKNAAMIAARSDEDHPTPADAQTDDLVESGIARLARLISDAEGAAPPNPVGPRFTRLPSGEFLPIAPATLAEARIGEAEVEAIVLKYLLSRVSANGREIAEQVSLPFLLMGKLLARMKSEHLVVHKGAAPVGDYVYQLTAAGMEDAKRYYKHSSYRGAAPVHLDDYITSVNEQSVTKQHPTLADLEKAFQGLLVNRAILNQIGQAIHAGQGFFLYGRAGNGKTIVAERVTQVFGEHIWVPRAIGVDGEIIRLFDPCNHVEVPLESQAGLESLMVDRRWVRIKRPAIVVGGELTMERLEITRNTATGVSEAPLQMKSNCGSLVLDDFGRQRIQNTELLNRWIVPLDRRYDFLNLASGKTIQVPFDQLLIFATNLEPRDLADEAFLRRIPYKIEAHDPTEAEFRQLFRMYAERFGCPYCEDAINHLIYKHYIAESRPFRFCQPRDLLIQIRNYCQFNKLPFAMSPEGFDIAVRNYFAVLG